MKKLVNIRPSASMLVAILAVVLAATGSAAASRLITGSDVQDSTLTTRDIKNKTLLRRDFKPGQLRRGPRGRRGLQGSTGPAGPRGRDGFGVLTSQSNSDVLGNGATGDVDATCPANTHPTGGDAYAVDDATGDPVDDVVKDDYFTGDGWHARAANNTGGDVDVIVDVICANGTVQ